MKIEKFAQPFEPVVITLESQKEVNELVAIFGHPDITRDTSLSESWEELNALSSIGAADEIRKLHRRLNKEA